MIPEDYKINCDYYRDLLKQIANRDMALPLDGTVNLPTSTTKGQQKIMTRSKFDQGTGNERNPDEDKSLDVI